MKAQLNGLKYNCSFLLEKRKDKKTNEIITINVPILMAVTFNGIRVFTLVGFRTNFDIWDSASDYPLQKKNTFNNDRVSATVINAAIRRHESAVDKVFMKLEKYPTKSEFIKLLNETLNKSETKVEIETDLFYYFEKYIEIKKPNISSWREKQLTTCKNHLKKFAKEKKKSLKIDQINATTLGMFETFLKGDSKNPRSQNTVSGLLIRLKSFFNFAYNQGWMMHKPFDQYKIEKEVYGDPIFLRKEELDIIYNKKLDNKKLDRVRDMFCLQCFIGARVGDFTQLTHENIINGTIQYIPSKTSREKATACKIPITKRAQAIIDKYDIPGGELVPYISGQKYNEYLKELFKLCEIKRKVAVLNPVTRKTEIVNIADIASSHLARRTFIGILFKSTKNEIISSMSGHVQGSKAFQRYYGITEDDQKDAISALE